jgi:ribose/xylose/arabinose/galactoside ABC-type transport system permease subunit
MAIVYAAAHFVLTRTTFGRYVYAMAATRGDAPGVASGHKTMIYGVAGLVSAIAAAADGTAQLGAADRGINYDFDAIAATVIGGTSLMGGEGTLAARWSAR